MKPNQSKPLKIRAPPYSHETRPRAQYGNHCSCHPRIDCPDCAHPYLHWKSRPIQQAIPILHRQRRGMHQHHGCLQCTWHFVHLRSTSTTMLPVTLILPSTRPWQPAPTPHEQIHQQSTHPPTIIVYPLFNQNQEEAYLTTFLKSYLAFSSLPSCPFSFFILLNQQNRS